MPILHAGLEADLRLAVTLDKGLQMILADTFGIRSSGAVTDYGSVNGTGSDQKRVRLVGLGGTDLFAATAAEDTDVAETIPADASADIAVVRRSLRRDLGDVAQFTGFAGSDLDPMMLSETMVVSYERHFNAVLAALFPALANVVGGGAGVDMTANDWYDALFQLELSDVPGPFYAMLHARQLADFQDSLRAEAGAAQFQDATWELMQIKGPGYAGSYSGVDIYRSSDVTAAAGVRRGAMWGKGCFGYATGSPSVMAGAGTVVMSPGGELTVEINRDASRAVTEVVGNAYFGISEIEDLRGVRIGTDD